MSKEKQKALNDAIDLHNVEQFEKHQEKTLLQREKVEFASYEEICDEENNTFFDDDLL